MIQVCEEKGDLELKAFLVLAPTTGMRKGEILSRKWSDIDLDSRNPCIYVRQTKNDEPKRIQLPDMAVTALRALAYKSVAPIPGQTLRQHRSLGT